MSTARYGDGSLYGAVGLTYGEATVNRALTWGVLVDWDNDGTFTGENEANGRLKSLRLHTGREFLFDSSGAEFIHPDEGTLEIELLDTSRRYDPYAGGELVDYLYNDQPVQVVIRSESSGTTYYAFTGRIKNIRPNYGNIQTATIYAQGKAVELKKALRSSIYTNVQYDNQVSTALTLMEWDGGTDIDTTVSDQMAYHWFSGDHALTEIQRITDAAFGTFWVAEDGTATYRGRINPDTSTQSITEDDIDYGYGIQIPSPRDVLKNKARVYARSRTAVSNAEVWRLADKPLLATGAGNEIWADFTYNSKPATATSVTTVAATTDYTANDNVDGSGTNQTANISFSQTNFATTAKLIPTNSGSSTYLTLLKIRADIITTDDYTFTVYEDSTSIATYGEREMQIKTDWLQDLNTAAEYAQVFVSRFATPRTFPRFKFKRSSIDKQFTTPLLNFITINFSSRAITGEFRVGYIDRSWSINEPNVIDSVYYLEPNTTDASGSTWTFPMTFPTIFP